MVCPVVAAQSFVGSHDISRRLYDDGWRDEAAMGLAELQQNQMQGGDLMLQLWSGVSRKLAILPGGQHHNLCHKHASSRRFQRPIGVTSALNDLDWAAVPQKPR